MDIRPTATAPQPALTAASEAARAFVPVAASGPATTTAAPVPAGEVASSAATAESPADGEQPSPANGAELARAVDSINSKLQSSTPGLEFSIDDDSERLVVKVVDKNTREVIRQVPSREAIEMAKAIDKLQSLLVRQSA